MKPQDAAAGEDRLCLDGCSLHAMTMLCYVYSQGSLPCCCINFLDQNVCVCVCVCVCVTACVRAFFLFNFFCCFVSRCPFQPTPALAMSDSFPVENTISVGSSSACHVPVASQSPQTHLVPRLRVLRLLLQFFCSVLTTGVVVRAGHSERMQAGC